MRENPLVTIGMPVYNGERFIKSAIDSVLNQTYTNFELIITDDGSSDNTVNIVKAFNDPRIYLVENKKNRGISSQLNQQINLGKGKFFCRMDADDLMFPDRIQKQVDFLISQPDIDAIGTSVVVINDEDDIIGYREGSKPIVKNDFLKNHFVHPTVMGKMQWFRRFLYDTNLNGVEDIDLWFRGVKSSSSFEIFSEPLLYYRDPLKFKLPTYCFRQKQLKKFYKKTLSKNNKLTYIKMSLLGQIKTVLASLLTMLNMDEKMIARRNRAFTDNKKIEQFTIILNSVLKN